MTPTETDIQNALKNLTDPNTERDFMASKSAKNIKVDNGDVSVDIVLGYPANSVMDSVKQPRPAIAWVCPPPAPYGYTLPSGAVTLMVLGPVMV